MKGEHRLTWLIAFGFCLTISFSGIACLISGLQLDSANGWLIFAWCTAFSGMYCLLRQWRKQWILLLLLVGLSVFLWDYGQFGSSIAALFAKVVTQHRWGWVFPSQWLDGDPSAILCAWSTVTAILISRCICASKAAAPAVIAAVLPLAACIPSQEAQPGAIWVFVLLAALGLFLLSQGARRQNPVQGRRTLAMLLIPALLLSGFSVLVVPTQTFSGDSTILESIAQWFTGFSGAPAQRTDSTVSLSELGKCRQSKKQVMTVTAQTGGVLYLRGYTYNTYDNNTWSNTSEQPPLSWPSESMLQPAGQVRITTQGIQDTLLYPYYPAGGLLEKAERGMHNYKNETTFEYDRLILPAHYEALEQPNQPQTQLYTHLPVDTTLWAQKVLAPLMQTSVIRTANSIAQYVSQCAPYSLDAAPMDTDGDFVQWFVEQSAAGYCVHFATAAAVLLKAAGIPARYVTGYLVNTSPGQETPVYGTNAHAWVEYWVSGIGWLPLEATPAAALEAQLIPQETKKPAVKWWLWLLPPGAAALTVPCVFLVRRLWKKRKLRKASINERIMAAWQQVVKQAQKREESPPVELFRLAEKAKFSQHALREYDLLPFKQYLRNKS